MLKLLRNFGHVISHIHLNIIAPPEFGPPFDHALEVHIENYVAEYCSKSLRRFTFGDPPKFLFTENQTPFINVESIIFHGYIRLHEVQFNTIFPNLKHIELNVSHLFWKGFVDIAMPSLKNVFIDARASNRNRVLGLQENDIKKLLKLNPQIEDLDLRIVGFSDVILQGFNENLPNLKRFSFGTSSNYNVQRYHLDSVIDFTMHPFFKTLNIPFTFSKLERFEYFCKGIRTIESCVFDFLAENKHLKSITLHGVSGRISELFHLDLVLTSIEELSIGIFPHTDFPSDLILNLFSESQSLRKLTLMVYESTFESLNDSVKSKIVKQERAYGEFILTFYP